MFYQRFWFGHDKFGVTLGGGFIVNPGRYLVLLPPINGATASTGTPYFTENPGQKFDGYDYQITFDWMPTQFVTWRAEFTERGTNVPTWAGPGGMTPPGGNNGAPQNYACSNGANSGFGYGSLGQAESSCAANGNGGIWQPGPQKAGDAVYFRPDGPPVKPVSRSQSRWTGCGNLNPMAEFHRSSSAMIIFF